jgi:MFS family permease
VTEIVAGSRAPLYFGWKVVAALFLAGFVVYGGGLYCFVLFVTPLTEEFHWSRAATGGIVSAFWLTAPLIVFGGYATQRFGVARLLVAGILIEALCVLALPGVSLLWQMLLLRAAMGFGKLLFAITIPVTIAVWFSRRFGLALGIAWAGWHVGGMVLAPIVAAIIARFGWRGACVALGAALLTLGLAPMLWAQRVRSPAALGLAIDGETGAAAATTAARAAGSGRLLDLLGAPEFWLIAVATVFFYTTYGGLFAHQAAIVEAAGYSMQSASAVLGSTAGFAALGGLGIGWALDRQPLARVGIVLHVLLLVGALALLTVSYAPSLAALVLYAAAFGVTVGGSDVFFVGLMRRRFPSVSLDHTYSAWYSVELVTLLVAPVAAGKVYDLSGDYHVTLLLLAASAVLAALATAAALRSRPAA